MFELEPSSGLCLLKPRGMVPGALKLNHAQQLWDLSWTGFRAVVGAWLLHRVLLTELQHVSGVSCLILHALDKPRWHYMHIAAAQLQHV